MRPTRIVGGLAFWTVGPARGQTRVDERFERLDFLLHVIRKNSLVVLIDRGQAEAG